MKAKYQIRNILIPVGNEQDYVPLIAKKCNLSLADFNVLEILKKSVDTRHINHLLYNYTALVESTIPLYPSPDIALYQEPEPYIRARIHLKNPHPFIIGTGPAGLFAALELTEKGFAPYLFDMGDDVDTRAAMVERFWQTAELDFESNAQFGEGGAGAFSDGKLTNRNRDFYSSRVFDFLIRFGAPSSIRFDALPHLGTDVIRKIIKSIRAYLIEKGCIFHFRHKLDDLKIAENRISNVTINGIHYQPEALFLAIGNASRQTFSMLANKLRLESKSFAVGFRIEHPQAFINDAIWGKHANIQMLGNASYRLTHTYQKRGIYSFCMCPGGFVIAGSSGPGEIVTNGMSFQSRNHVFGNSAIVVTVSENDFGNGILNGINFQKNIEEKAYNPSFPFAAPVQSALSFQKNQVDSCIPHTTYRPHTYLSDLGRLFPVQLTNSLQKGLANFANKIPGFIENGILIGPETRTSSPVRILRDKDLFCSLNAKNLFPVGEGAGYAGGIISSASDGVKAATVIHGLSV